MQLSNLDKKCDNCFCKDLPYACPAKYLNHIHFCHNADPNHAAHKPRRGETVRNLCQEHQIPMSQTPINVDIATGRFNYVLNTSTGKINFGVVFKDIDENILSVLKTFQHDRIHLTAVYFPKEVNSDIQPPTDVVFGEAGLEAIETQCDIVGYINHMPLRKENIIQILIGIIANPQWERIDDKEFIKQPYKALVRICKKHNLIATDNTSFLTKLKNVSGAVVRAGLHAAQNGGNVNVPEDVYKARLDICRKCPLLDPESQSCSQCGCVVARKARLASESCPKDPPSWEIYQIDAQTPTGGCGCNKKTPVSPPTE